MAPKKPKKTTTPQEWGNIYKGRYATYQKFTDKLQNLIRDLLQKHNIDAQIESRTKSIESFVEKIQREGRDYRNPLEEITDLVGIRIIAYYKEDVDKICEIIEKEFNVDWENSIDKAQTLDPDRFGYLSVHYVVSLSFPREGLTEWKAFANIKAEIQVRTTLQHAWAAISHKLVYKRAKEVPKSLRRQLFRLSALLELADEEFSNLTKLVEEAKEHCLRNLEHGELDIEINLLSLEQYLFLKRYSLEKEWLVEIGFFPVPYPVEINRGLVPLLDILELTGITTLEELDELVKNAWASWAKDVLSLLYNTSLYKGLREHYPLNYPHDFITLLVLYAKRDVVNEKTIEQTDFPDELKKAIREVIITK